MSSKVTQSMLKPELEIDDLRECEESRKIKICCLEETLWRVATDKNAVAYINVCILSTTFNCINIFKIRC